MIVVLQTSTDETNLQNVVKLLNNKGFITEIVRGTEKTIVGAVGDKSRLIDISIESLDGVEKVIPILAPYKLASREFKPHDTIVQVSDVIIGGPEVVVMAGPCAVESKEQLLESADIVKKAGAKILRGGAFKPRSSPYSFQGLEKQGMEYLAMARDKTGLPIVTEVIDGRSLELAVKYADILQIGARNMQNFSLLQEVAQAGMPILLKRGISASIEEWILAAEYILKAGNPQVVLCERGIRTFETNTRNTLDMSAVPAIKQLTHLPIIVDPSHSTGKWRYVQPMALGAVASGADGLLIEVHPNPKEALCDGPQSLEPQKFEQLMQCLAPVARAVNRELNI